MSVDETEGASDRNKESIKSRNESRDEIGRSLRTGYNARTVWE